MWSEEDFVKLLQSGNENAFHVLVDRYSLRVYNISLRLLNKKQDAEDITQEVFTTLFLSISTFRNESSLSTWIHRITINKCHEFNRKQQRKKRAGQMVELDQLPQQKQLSIHNDPSTVLEQKELYRFIETTIQSLPENQRIAYLLSKFEGNKNDQIAEIMELSISAVESLIFRAKKTLVGELNTFLDDK